MNLLLEQEVYPKLVLESLGLQVFLRQAGADNAKMNYVGFFRDLERHATVFTLPKIFGEGRKLLGKHDTQIFSKTDMRSLLTPGELQTVHTLIERVYFSLKHYKEKEDQSSVQPLPGYAIKSNIGKNAASSFEAMLSLIAFHRSNPDLISQERQIARSRNPRKIDWKATFAGSVPLQDRDEIFYLELLGVARTKRLTDPLLVIFYSLLNEFKQYDPTISISSSNEILPPAILARLRHRISIFLRASRSQYFSDKFRQLHALLESYYDAERASYGNQSIEFLLTDDFEIVFETMVDTLLSDEWLLDRYKNLKDGRQIDHLFGEADAFGENKIIYIGDSKYYRDPSRVSIQKYKQFTYARNIIQENIYVLNNGPQTIYSRNYRDPVSEGYNVTPNFFLLARARDDLKEDDSIVKVDASQPAECSVHFPNRLFDRDTLHILYFNIDFIGLLNFFTETAKRLPLARQMLREGARSVIRTELSRYLNDKYEFYNLTLDPQKIEHNFKMLQGKLYSSPAIRPIHIMALERNHRENSTIMSLMKSLGQTLRPISLLDLSKV